MDSAQAFNLGYAVVGALLILVSLSHSYIARLPLSAAMLYLLVGAGMGPMGLHLLRLDPLDDSVLLERLTEVAVIVSLFVAGMKLDLPLRDRRWRVPVALATASMGVTVAAVTAAGVFLLGLPLGVSVLLGAVLAPTDPVLASDVQLSNAGDRDRLRFGLTGEGGLNDGTAFPFVMLGLGLTGLHDLGTAGARWWLVDVVWATLGGLAIGWIAGSLVGRAVLHLRLVHREAWGSDEFISLGLIGLAYGLALLCSAYGFLAVFAAGLALGRKDRQQRLPASGQAAATERAEGLDKAVADAGPATSTGPDPSPMAAVQRFNLQLERMAEVGVVLAVGVLLARTEFMPSALWFVPLLFLVIRPISVWVGLKAGRVRLINRRQLAMMGWFGIRGIGSIYYLMYAVSHGLNAQEASSLVSLTLATVVSSMVLHGVSVTPLMNWYESRRRMRSGGRAPTEKSMPQSKPPNRSS